MSVLIDSGLFDADFYLGRYPFVRDSPLDPAGHYFKIGVACGYDPHPLFDTSFYVSRYPESGASGMDPFGHYLTIGVTRDWQPNPLFDPVYYRRVHSLPASTQPFEHYISSGGQNLTTHILFDPDYYLAQVPQAAASPLTVLGYYLHCWPQNRRSPHPLFDIPGYGAQCEGRYVEFLASGYDPISHYLLTGADCGYAPHPLFDTAYYYRVNPDVKAAGWNALVHYLEAGALEGRDPHQWFDSSWYLERYPDVARAGYNPLLHYVVRGADEKRDPHPMFRASYWSGLYRLPDNGPASLIHFASYLEKTGEHPLVALRLRDHSRRHTVDGRPGVNLIGWPRLEIGFGEYMREVARAFASVTPDFGIRDTSGISPAEPGDDSVSAYIRPECRFNTNLFVMNADNMMQACGEVGLEAVRDRFNIALWAWELAEYPDVWRQEMAAVDEFWAFSLFNQQCLSMKATVPVLYMPQAVTISPGAGLSRAAFGMPSDRFVYLFQFDFTSFIDRKNPYAAIAAFRKAFPRRNPGAVLVIKTNHSERYPEKMRQLRDAMAGDPDIVLLDGTFRRPKLVSLMESCDVFVSLHRSEGFGRSLAEAMLMGKPVVATNYSGNTEFMTQENSCPVNYTLVAVKEGQYPHGKGQVWAEADVDHAAWHMRRLMEDRAHRESVSRAARQTIAERYNLQVTGARYIERLRLLGLMNTAQPAMKLSN